MVAKRLDTMRKEVIMSNKSTGTQFEKDFADILAENRFWVHNFQDNKNGQPCDVIASKDGKSFLFDCKDCETKFFQLSRMEENQLSAMTLFEMYGNEPGMFAIRFPSTHIYLMHYRKMKEIRDAGFKKIDETICDAKGLRLEAWLLYWKTKRWS